MVYINDKKMVCRYLLHFDPPVIEVASWVLAIHAILPAIVHYCFTVLNIILYFARIFEYSAP